MGIDYDSILVFGWQVEYEDAVRFLIQNKVGTCGGTYEEDPETKEVQAVDGKKRGNLLLWTQSLLEGRSIPSGSDHPDGTFPL